ncbi:MAG: hypothetical protein D6734_09935 [Candidatus Schekmanbacteria bacterium]|nr:MAG: hypothetical protein D6734_09935 [Candidatus Schekmanbacteria bacterium]
MLTEFFKRYESYLNKDEELKRRLKGFKTFAGPPDGHYRRARKEGEKAVARAVRCYPFGGKSSIGKNSEVIGINVKESGENFLIALSNGKFSIKKGNWEKPYLVISLPLEKLKKAILGRYRWIWLIGLDDVEVSYSEELPHSDWVTIFEILVAMQEVPEFENKWIDEIEKL